jgi:hypothetical protein
MVSRRRSKKSPLRRSKRGKKGVGSCKKGSFKKLSLISIKKSPKKDKKYVASFCKNGRVKQTHFGAKGYQNYGGVGKDRHLSKERKKRYIQRHKSRENWNDPTSAGALSRYVLWDKPSFREGVASFKRRFKI